MSYHREIMLTMVTRRRLHRVHLYSFSVFLISPTHCLLRNSKSIAQQIGYITRLIDWRTL